METSQHRTPKEFFRRFPTNRVNNLTSHSNSATGEMDGTVAIFMKSTLDLSVIVPTFRRPKMLEEALCSVVKTTDLALEILVVDDDPAGEALNVVNGLNDPRIRYFKFEPNSGGKPAKLRNWAAQQARGDILYFLDDDDRVVDGALSAGVKALSAANAPNAPSASVLLAGVVPFGESEERVQDEVRYFLEARRFLRWFRGRKSILAQLLFGNSPIVCSCCMVKRSAFLATGGFDMEMRLWEDCELYIRAIRQAGVTFAEFPLLERRVGQVALSASASAEDIAEAYRYARAQYSARYGVVELLQLKFWSKAMDYWTLIRR